MRLAVVLALVLGLAACQRAEEKKKITTGSGSAGSGSAVSLPSHNQAKTEQITPPLDLSSSPIDAIKTSSGLIYKKLTTVEGAPAPKRNDTVLINYTGWRQ